MAGVAVDLVAAAAAALFVPPATPFRIARIMVDLVVGPAFGAALAFLTTVPALASLVSLVFLGRRPARVAGRDAGALAVVAAPLRRTLEAAVVPVDVELVSEVVVTFLVPLARVALAFSTMLDKTFVAAAEREVPVAFSGEPGRAMYDFVGDAGRSRFARREFEDVGERT